MQTTLLGLAIAFIIALVAALIGPHFVDWNKFRPQFEAEASRVLGAPVRVEGSLDARLLPTPTLHLRSVTVGGPNDPKRINAEKFDVEFSLSSAMRGEWRASELSIDGFAIDFGIDKQGRFEGPLKSSQFNFGALTIDRLNLSGQVKLHDAASGASLQFDDLKFSGDVRALAGTMRGEGSFNFAGAPVLYRVSSGQSTDGKGTRVRLSLDPGDRAPFSDFDGTLSFDALVPKFDGAVTVARTADGGGEKTIPWRITSKTSVSPASATFEQVEFVYGPEDSPLRFSGNGDIRFGVSPLLHLALSTRQLDVDRLLAKTMSAESIDLLSRLRRALRFVPAAPIATQLEANVDQAALGGRPIENLVVELRSDKSRWTIPKFEMRAPGVTQIAATGTISSAGTAAASFVGPVALESSDPGSFFAWLQGRADASLDPHKPFKLSGTVKIAADRIAVEDTNADLGGGVVTGSVAVSDLTGGKTRVDAALKSDGFNFDEGRGIAGLIGETGSKWPDETKISVDIGRTILAGLDVRPVIFELETSARSISLNRLNIGDAKSVSVTGSGLLDLEGGSGKLSLDARAESLDRIGMAFAPWVPEIAKRIKSVPQAQGDTRVRMSVSLNPEQNQAVTNASVAINVEAPQIKGTIALQSKQSREASRNIDLTALLRGDGNLDIKLASDKSSTMLSLLGLDRILSAQDGEAKFDAKLSGALNRPLRVNARLLAAGINGDVNGTIDPWLDAPKANLGLALRKADPSTLFDLKPASVGIENLSSRLSVAGKAFAFEDLDAVFGGSRTRGKIAIVRGDNLNVDGELSIDALDLSPVVAAALGIAGRSATDPSGRGLLTGWRGLMSFQASNINLPGGSAVQNFGGKLRANGQSLALEGKGSLGSGEISANADARQTSEGTSIRASANATDVDGSALRYRSLLFPEGKASFLVSFTTQGRSSAALSGALSGAGVVTLKDLRVAGLDPRAFEAAVRASDSGQPTDDVNLKTVVEPVLTNGSLAIPAGQIPFTIKEGRVRVEPTSLDAPRTRATVSGGLDLAADQMDARIVLSAAVLKPATRRPEIRIDFNGSPDNPMRSVDVASLSSWLVMRAIDRQTQQLDRLESGDSSRPEPQPMSLDEGLPQVEPIPKGEVRIPKRDPRRSANVKSSSSSASPNASPQQPSAPTAVAPLPPATTIRPAPGAAKPRPPVVLMPPVAGTSSF
ncbi:MAG: AsmA family protein [Rhizobiales bacterium]|nr:AsmA family protein [Hyphomicrobiales bacterium]